MSASFDQSSHLVDYTVRNLTTGDGEQTTVGDVLGAFAGYLESLLETIPDEYERGLMHAPESVSP